MAETKSLQAKLVEAWGGIKNPELDSVNPHFKSRYASLKETQRVIREACNSQGLMYQQRLMQCEDGQYRLYSYVMDTDGSTIELSTFPVENVPNSQAFGSEMTYKKRQQAQTDWGIVGEEDEDGEAIAGQQNSASAKSAAKPKSTQPRANGSAQQQTQTSRYAKLKELKAQAIELGITEDGMNGAISNILQGKPMKDATDTELKACEGCISGLIRDKRQLLQAQGLEADDGGQR